MAASGSGGGGVGGAARAASGDPGPRRSACWRRMVSRRALAIARATRSAFASEGVFLAGILAALGLAGLHLPDVAFGGHDQGGVQAAPLLAGDLDQLSVDLFGQADGHFHDGSFRHATSVAAFWWRGSGTRPPPLDVVALCHYNLSGG